jgi:hypothetical protein
MNGKGWKPLILVLLRKINSYIRKAEEQRLLGQYISKVVHSGFLKHLREHNLSSDLMYAFLKSADLKAVTQGFMMACLNTLDYRRAMLKQPIPKTLCRVGKVHHLTLMYLLSACLSYAGSFYIDRLNASLLVIYYHLRHGLHFRIRFPW